MLKKITNSQLFSVFTGNGASGNLARVYWVDALPDIKQHLAMEDTQNITSTYLVAQGNNHFSIRWFNQHQSIQRCGHATLAAAAFIQRQTSQPKSTEYYFQSDTETLRVNIKNDKYSIDLPIEKLQPLLDKNHHLFSLLNHPKNLFTTQGDKGYVIAELQHEQSVQNVCLTKQLIEGIGKKALIITAKDSTQTNGIVFRYFAPYYGQPEDAATGSAASLLWPFWETKNGTLPCRQLSPRGGCMILSTHKTGYVTVSGKVEAFPNNAH